MIANQNQILCHTIQYLRRAVILTGFFASLAAIAFVLLSPGFIHDSPFGQNEWIYSRDIKGSWPDDSLMFFCFALVNLPVCIIMIFVPKKILTLPCLAIFWTIWYMASLCFESESFWALIFNTIKYTHHPLLILYTALLCICAILTLIYTAIVTIRIMVKSIHLAKSKISN